MNNKPNQQPRQDDEPRHGEVQRPINSLVEQTLAVDLARADIDQAIATAHKYPRILDVVVKKIETMACYNEAAAENSIYSLPRGGKPIIGPSIGFANILAQAWGNCIDGARIVYIDRKEKAVIAEGAFHDLESNRKTILPVQRRIVDRQGRIFSDDMIMVTGMAAASIARRNAILNAVPRALWHPVYEQALQIVRGDMETFAERKDKALKAFAQFGVKPEQVFGVLGIKGDVDMTLEHIAPMRGMYSALREGSITVEEMFDPRRQRGTGFETVANPLSDEEHDQETGEVRTDAPAPGTEGKAQTAKEAAAPAAPVGGQASAEAKTATEPKAGETAQEAAPSPAKGKGGKGAKGKNTEKGKQAEPKPPVELQKPAEPAQQAAAEPKNAEQYKEHLKGWLAKSSSATAVEDTWRAERQLRTTCSVMEDAFIEMKALKEARVAELAG